MKHINFIRMLVIVLLLTGFTFTSDDSLIGVWVRKSDALKIRVTAESPEEFLSTIVDEGNEKFPCEVSHLPIYKSIRAVRKNLWSCDFLVVTMGSCHTAYEEGMIRLTKEGDLEIICPGFDTKVYSKLRPRYEQ